MGSGRFGAVDEVDPLIRELLAAYPRMPATVIASESDGRIHPNAQCGAPPLTPNPPKYHRTGRYFYPDTSGYFKLAIDTIRGDVMCAHYIDLKRRFALKRADLDPAR